MKCEVKNTCEVNTEKLYWKTQTLNSKTALQYSDIFTKVIKENSDIFPYFLFTAMNSSMKPFLFSSCLITADVTPAYKKRKKDLTGNYRRVSISPVMSFFFFLKNASLAKYPNFSKTFSSKTKSNFRRGEMFKERKESVDKGKVFGFLLRVLSKAFGCAEHDLVIAKLSL